jgi:hypothetical protein
MVPAHLTIEKIAQILLKRAGEAGITAVFSSNAIQNMAEMTLESVFEQFFENAEQAEGLNRILDLKYDR